MILASLTRWTDHASPGARFLRPEPILTGTALAMALSLALTVPAYFVDTRMVLGENVWLKPIKFQIALTVYLLTLAVFAAWLPAGHTAARGMRVFLGVVAAAALIEILWVVGAAMYGIESHYNTGPVMAVIYNLMGVAAILLTSASLVFGWAFWRDRGSLLQDPLRLALALGLILTFGLTVVAASKLASLPGHFIGTPVTGAVWPIMGWSREVGDLRVAHFLATHALHVVPLIGLAAAALLNRHLARAVVWAGAAGYVGVTALAYTEALAGRPFP